VKPYSLSLRGVSWPGLVIITVVVLGCLIIAGFGLIAGPIFLTVLALVFLIPFLCTAPFVFAGRWRKPAPTPTRRPVVRRRRA